MFRRALQQWRRDLKRLDEMRIKVHRTEGDSTDFSVDCQVRAARFTCENEPCIHTNTHTHSLSLLLPSDACTELFHPAFVSGCFAVQEGWVALSCLQQATG